MKLMWAFSAVHIKYNKGMTTHSNLTVERTVLHRLPVKGGAWLRRFDDVTGVEKSCVAKGINRKKAKEKYLIIANKYALPLNM